jgi:hypothetical protein
MSSVDIQILGDQIASLTPAEAEELSRYLFQSNGCDPCEEFAVVGPIPHEGGAHADTGVRTRV